MRWRALAGVVGVLVAACGDGSVAPTTRPAQPLLRKVDGFPLYEMSDASPTPKLWLKPRGSGWACTVFAADGGSPIVGRNFDFHDQPALLLHHRPPGAYASVSMVDMEYLGLDRAHLARLNGPKALALLKQAAAIPFDGMNEKGLVVTMAAVPSARAPRQPRTAGGLGVMRLALDHAKDVAQGVKIFETTGVDFQDGPPLHYLVADAQGASAVIEYVHGRVHVIPRGATPYQAMTNFVRSTTPRPHDRRYRIVTTALQAAHGDLDAAATLNLLRAARQPITRWSIAYDPRARTMSVAMGQRYERVLRFGVFGSS